MQPRTFIAIVVALTVVVLAWSVGRQSIGQRAPAIGGGPADESVQRRRLAWFDRVGRETPIPAPARAYVYPRLSPDGRLLALDIRDEQDGLWVWDFGRHMLTALSVGRASDIAPVWAHSGEWLLFARGRGVAPGLWTVRTPRGQDLGHGQAGSSAGKRLPADSNSLLMPTSLSPDDRHLLAATTAPAGFDILLVDLSGDRPPTGFVTTTADDLNAEVSPDGRWVAYESRRSGRSEIWLRRLWDEAVDRQVTTEGATRPAWTKGGRELVYLNVEGGMVARSIDVSTLVPGVGEPIPLFAVDIYRDLVGRTFDVTPDGDRFVVIRDLSRETGRSVGPDDCGRTSWIVRSENLKKAVFPTLRVSLPIGRLRPSWWPAPPASPCAES